MVDITPESRIRQVIYYFLAMIGVQHLFELSVYSFTSTAWIYAGLRDPRVLAEVGVAPAIGFWAVTVMERLCAHTAQNPERLRYHGHNEVIFLRLCLGCMRVGSA